MKLNFFKILLYITFITMKVSTSMVIACVYNKALLQASFRGTYFVIHLAYTLIMTLPTVHYYTHTVTIYG